MDDKQFYTKIMQSILREKIRLVNLKMKPTHITINVFTLKKLSEYLEWVLPSGDLRYATIHGLKVVYSDTVDKNSFIIGFECILI